MSALSVQIDLTGNLAGALEKGNKALGDTEKGANKAAKEFALFETETGKLSGELGGLGFNLSALAKGGSLFTFDLAEGAEVAFDAIKKVAEAVFDLGKEMVLAAADAQDLSLAIKLNVGEEGAEKVDKLADSFSNSAFSPKQIKEALLPILEESGTEHEDQWNDLTTAATDVATRRHTGIAGAKEALSALNDIELNPQRLRGSLKQLGVKQLDFYNDLGALLGISEKAAEAQTKAGQIKSQTLLSVALHQIAQREGGALGNATNEGSKTLGATLSRIGQLKDTLFDGIADSPGMQAIQGFLDNVESTLKGPLGQELVSEISGVFTTLFGDLSGPDGAQKVQAAIKDLADEAKDFIHSFRDAWPDIKEGFESTVPVIKLLVDTLESAVALAKLLASLNPSNYMDEARKANPEGDPLGRWFQSHLNTGKSFTAGAVGEDDVPRFADGGIVNGPTLALIGEDGPEAVVPLERMGSMSDVSGGLSGGYSSSTFSPEVNLTINVNSSAQGGAEIANDIAQPIRVEVVRIFTELRNGLGG